MDNFKKREIKKCKMTMHLVVVEQKDMLKLPSEVIVNSIGPDISFGGAIAKFIIKKCGKKIIKEATKEIVKKYGKEEIMDGGFVSTKALKSKDHKFVIHCCCPYWEDYENKKKAYKILKDMIIEICDCCGKKGINSLALPPMGSGVCEFPTEIVSQAFFDGIMEYLEKVDMKTSLSKIHICVLEKEKYNEFKDEWQSRINEKFPEGQIEDDPSSSSSSESDEDDDDDDEDKKENIVKSHAKANRFNIKQKDDSSSDSDLGSKSKPKVAPNSLSKPKLANKKNFKPKDDTSSDSDSDPKPKVGSKLKNNLQQNSQAKGSKDSSKVKKSGIAIKNRRRSSSDSDSSGGRNSKPKITTIVVKSNKNKKNDSDSDDSDEEKKNSKPKSIAKKPVRKGSSDSSSSDGGKGKKAPNKKIINKKRAVSSSDDDDSDSSSDRKKKKAIPKKNFAKKKVSDSSDNDSDSSD